MKPQSEFKKMAKSFLHEGRLNELSSNEMILDMIDDIHAKIKILQKDDSLDKSLRNQLFSNFKPLFNTLHKMVK